MPLYADNSPNIGWPLPAPQVAFKKQTILSEKSFQELRSILEAADWGPGSGAKYHTISGRWTHNPEIPEHIQQELLSVARDSWREPELEQSFIFAARYQKQGGITPYLWEHLDDTSSQFLLDICVEKNELDDWGLIVEGARFSEEENAGVFFNGQQHIHSRPKYPSNSETAYLVAFFAIYTKPGDWAHGIDRSSIDRESFIALAEKYTYDADIRFYEARGHPMVFNNLPEGNYTCESCQECYVSAPDFIKRIDEHVSKK